MATVGESFGKITIFYPQITAVSANPFVGMVEDWMVGRLLPYAKMYEDITSGWTAQNQPEWKGPARIAGSSSDLIVVALQTLSTPFVWLDEGDENGNPVERKVRIEPAIGATKARTFKTVGPSKKVKRNSKGKKQFLPRNRKAKIEPRRWSRELIKREDKKLRGSRPYFSKSKVYPGILFTFEQIAFAPVVKKEFSRGQGYKLRRRSVNI